MDFKRRVKLYVFGFLMGLLILMIILKGKKCSSVQEIKVEQLSSQTIMLSDKAACQLKCLNLNIDSLRRILPAKFHVNYDRSEVHAIPFGKFFIESNKPNEYPFTVVITDSDTISKIQQFDMKTTCPCDTLSKIVK